MNTFLIGLNLTGQNAMIVGVVNSARFILKTTVKLIVVAPTVRPKVHALAASGAVTLALS